jgi:C1A family cysteine protease
MANSGDNKTLWRGLILLIGGILLGSLGNYIYANRAKLKTFVVNLKKQLPDFRDFSISDLFSPIDEDYTPLPATVDLREKCPPIYNQGNIGSCTAQAGCAARVMLSDLKVSLSRLYQYYYERVLENSVSEDAGATMRDIGKSMKTYGVSEESLHPYVVNNFANEPSTSAKSNAEKYKIATYYSISTLKEIRQTLQTQQKPILALVELYDSFSNTPSSGLVSMPEGSFVGNHAMLIVGYSDEGKYLIVRNSWGEGWGKLGYCFLPYEYVEKGYASDFWFLSME